MRTEAPRNRYAVPTIGGHTKTFGKRTAEELTEDEEDDDSPYIPKVSAKRQKLQEGKKNYHLVWDFVVDSVSDFPAVDLAQRVGGSLINAIGATAGKALGVVWAMSNSFGPGVVTTIGDSGEHLVRRSTLVFMKDSATQTSPPPRMQPICDQPQRQQMEHQMQPLRDLPPQQMEPRMHAIRDLPRQQLEPKRLTYGAGDSQGGEQPRQQRLERHQREEQQRQREEVNQKHRPCNAPKTGGTKGPLPPPRLPVSSDTGGPCGPLPPPSLPMSSDTPNMLTHSRVAPSAFVGQDSGVMHSGPLKDGRVARGPCPEPAPKPFALDAAHGAGGLPGCLAPPQQMGPQSGGLPAFQQMGPYSGCLLAPEQMGSQAFQQMAPQAFQQMAPEQMGSHAFQQMGPQGPVHFWPYH